jgi:diphthamide biosynthesis protein 4
VITIDHLTHAYHTLLSPTLRHACNLTLSADDSSSGSDAVVQTVDLDELLQQQHPEDEKRRWTRGCRYGEVEGYVITEVELEEAAADGDGDGVGVVLVECVGCSLWLKVEFGVVDDEEGEGVSG